MNAIFKRVTNSSIGKDTFYKFKDALPALMDWLDTHDQRRYNEVNIGKSMDFNHPLHYPGIDHPEYVCREDWIASVAGTTVPLQIYHENMAYPAGVVQFSKNPDSGEDAYIYDREEVLRVLEQIGKKNGRLYKKLMAGETPAISTEYDCDTKWNDEHKVWLQRNFRNVSVALVDQGNCPDWLCALKKLNEGFEQINEENDDGTTTTV
jgi:hypothetical protein